jgi:ribose transport system permease protein
VSTQTTLPPAGAQPQDGGRAEPRGGLSRIGRLFIETPEAGVVAACVLFFLWFAFKAPTFHHVSNLQVIGRDLGEQGILAIGESLVILTGGIDLSVGALAGFAGIMSAWFNVNAGMPAPAAILLTIVLCGVVGLWHGTMVTRLNVPPFVITLVTYTVTIGAALAITSGTPISGTDPLFQNLSAFYVVEVPVPALIFVGVVAVAWFALERTYVGRQIYAVGGNKEAARLAAIPVRRRITSVYVASSSLAAIVGILAVGRESGTADPSVGASGWELVAIASAVVGGVSLFGGEGRIVGIAAGAILLEIISNGLLATHVNQYDLQMVQGAVLGVAILLDRVRARRFGKERK